MAVFLRTLGLGFLLFGLAACSAPNVDPKTDNQSFEDCLINGGTIAESYPRQCTINNQTITEDIAIGNKDERRVLRFQVAAQRVKCQIN